MTNTLTAVVPKLLAQGLLALREMAVTPRLVNRAYESMAGQRGTTIDVPIPSAIVAQQVAPANVPPSTAGVSPTSVPITLDQWYEAPFYLTDKEKREVMEGVIPMQASEAIKAIVNQVDTHLLSQYKEIYGYHGTAGTTPFGSGTTADATAIRKILNNQLAPMDPRHVIMDADCEAAALNLRAFQDASYSGSVDALMNGNLNRKLGFGWWMNQNTPTHTAGLGGGTPLTNGTQALGATSIASDGWPNDQAGTLKKGDIITFAGHTQTYVVTADVDSGSSTGPATIPISPGLQVAVGDGVTITLKASHVVNLAFHRDAIALATRPLDNEDAAELGSIIRSAVDPISGLTLRLEVTREHRRTRYAFDMLWGAKVVRPELAARLAG